MEPIRYYTAYQEANASFMIAKLLPGIASSKHVCVEIYGYFVAGRG